MERRHQSSILCDIKVGELDEAGTVSGVWDGVTNAVLTSTDSGPSNPSEIQDYTTNSTHDTSSQYPQTRMPYYNITNMTFYLLGPESWTSYTKPKLSQRRIGPYII